MGFHAWRAMGCLLALLLPSLAVAQELVSLSLAPELSASLASRLESAIAGQLAELARVERDVAKPTLCRVRVERVQLGLAVAFSEPDGRTISARDLRGAPDELIASEVASVVRAVVLSLLERRATGPSQAAPAARSEPADGIEPEATARTRDEPPRTPGRFWLSAFYTGATYAPQLAWQSGARIEALYRVWRSLHAGLGYAYHPPVNVLSTLADIRVSDHTVSAFAGLARSGSRFGYGADLVIGATDTLRTTTRTASGVQGTGDSSAWSATLALRARARARVTGALWLELSPAVELPVGLRDSTAGISTETIILSPRTVHGRLDVGASFELP